jgi:hypothetical protein
VLPAVDVDCQHLSCWAHTADIKGGVSIPPGEALAQAAACPRVIAWVSVTEVGGLIEGGHRAGGRCFRGRFERRSLPREVAPIRCETAPRVPAPTVMIGPLLAARQVAEQRRRCCARPHRRAGLPALNQAAPAVGRDHARRSIGEPFQRINVAERSAERSSGGAGGEAPNLNRTERQAHSLVRIAAQAG